MGCWPPVRFPSPRARQSPWRPQSFPETAPQAAGGLNALTKADPPAAQPASTGEVSDGEDAVVVTVTAKDASGQDVAFRKRMDHRVLRCVGHDTEARCCQCGLSFGGGK